MEIHDLKIDIFADGADLQAMIDMASKEFIKGLTTNPTLMRRAGINNYRDFALQVLDAIKYKPVSFEVFSDDIEEMRIQALEIARWGDNVNVKIPVTNSRGLSTTKLIKSLSNEGIKLNVTALMTTQQVCEVFEVLNSSVSSFISVFAGRIADTGRDPIPIMQTSLEIISTNRNVQLIWASPRELLNIIQANEIGCHVITATSDILNKLELIGKDLTEYSLETVLMFRKDAISSGYQI